MGVDRRASTVDLSWFIDLEKNGQLQLNPPYQRKSVWTSKDKKFFLNTIFNNFPCPAFYIQKDITSAETKYNVVDGKQRLTAILDFYKGKTRLSEDMGDINLNGKKWNDIKDKELYKRKFLDYVITVEQLNSIDGNGWNDVFYRLNKNAKTLSRQELRHAQFDGWFINRAEQETEFEKIWQNLKISTPSKARRMKDTEFISILLLIVLEEKIVGFPQSNLDELYEKYNEVSKTDNENDEETFFQENSMGVPDDDLEDDTLSEHLMEIDQCAFDEDGINAFEERLKAAKSYIRAIIAASDVLTENKVFARKRTTHLYSVWTYVVLSGDEMSSKAEDCARKLETFFAMYEEVEKANPEEYANLVSSDEKYRLIIQYFENASGAATEEEQRKKRLNAMQQFLQG